MSDSWRPGLYIARLGSFPWRDAVEAPVQGWLIAISETGAPVWGAWSRRMDVSIPEAKRLAEWLGRHGSPDHQLMVLWASSLRAFSNASWSKVRANHPYTVARTASVCQRPFCRETELADFLRRIPLIRHYEVMGLI